MGANVPYPLIPHNSRQKCQAPSRCFCITTNLTMKSVSMKVYSSPNRHRVKGGEKNGSATKIGSETKKPRIPNQGSATKTGNQVSTNRIGGRSAAQLSISAQQLSSAAQLSSSAQQLSSAPQLSSSAQQLGSAAQLNTSAQTLCSAAQLSSAAQVKP